jgi:predicted metalloprotease
VILGEVNPSLRKIRVKELEEKRILLEGIPAYGATHEMEHLEKGEIKGIPLWNFEYIKEPTKKNQKKIL